jgi:hypothetical protein
MQNKKDLPIIVILVIVNIAIILALIFSNLLYFNKYNLENDFLSGILLNRKDQESASSKLQLIKDDLNSNDQFNDLKKNGDWPIDLDDLEKNEIPFEN